MTNLSLHPRRPRLILAIALALSLGACRTTSSPPSGPPARSEGEAQSGPHALLNAVLWVQTAPEYRALALQAFASGRRMLDLALEDPSWSALPGQSAVSLPPAVILDVDETVLDNSPYEARLIRSGGSFDAESWASWVGEERAEPIPGAVEFTQYAQSRGVAVFFVTNRTESEEAATRANLARAGFPLDPDVDSVLTRGEQSARPSSDKEQRRRFIASTHRVVLLFGDALGDFVSSNATSVAAFRAEASRYSEYWGTKWLVLPNPMYGAWEQQILRAEPRLSPDEALERKRQTLNTAAP